MLGRRYVIDHCMSALRAYRCEEAFKTYVADGLYAIVTKNIEYTKRYSEVIEDILHPKTKKEKEEEQQKSIERDKEEAKRIQENLKAKLRGDTV